MSDFADRLEDREAGRRSPPQRVTAGGPRFPLFTKIVAILLVIAAPVAALALQKPGTEGEVGGIKLETGNNVWFCVAGSTDPGTAELIDIANASSVSATGRYTWFVGDQRLESQQLAVPPAGRLEIDGNRELVGRPSGQRATAVIELDTTSVATAETVAINSKEATGTMSAPCTSGTGGTRFFAGGSSVRGAETYLILSNPFPQDAVVNVDVYSDTGIERPNNLQRLPLFAGKSTVVKVSDEVRRRSALGTAVRSETGQVVAQQSVYSNGDRIPAGVSLSAGSTAPALEWWFGDGEAVSDVAQSLSIMNPSDSEALVEVGFMPEGPTAEANRIQSTRVAPNAETTLTIDAGYSPGTRFSTTVRSANDRPIVVERMVGYSAPPAHGLTFAPGLAAPARNHVVANAWGASPQSPYSTSLILANPSGAPAKVTVGRMSDGSLAVPERLRDVVVPPGQRLTLPVSEAFPGVRSMSLGIVSDGDVFAEARTKANPPGTGFESQAATQLPASFVMPPLTSFAAPEISPTTESSPTASPAQSPTA